MWCNNMPVRISGCYRSHEFGSVIARKSHWPRFLPTARCSTTRPRLSGVSAAIGFRVSCAKHRKGLGRKPIYVPKQWTASRSQRMPLTPHGSWRLRRQRITSGMSCYGIHEGCRRRGRYPILTKGRSFSRAIVIIPPGFKSSARMAEGYEHCRAQALVAQPSDKGVPLGPCTAQRP
jgi:hypothetical protein